MAGGSSLVVSKDSEHKAAAGAFIKHLTGAKAQADWYTLTTDLPANAKRKKLRDIGCKVIRGDSRPEPLTLDEYCERQHALVSFSGDLSGNIDLDLARQCDTGDRPQAAHGDSGSQ